MAIDDRDETPQFTTSFKVSKVARSILPQPDLTPEEEWAISKTIGEFLMSALDEVARLEMQGYKLIPPSEILGEGKDGD